MVETFIDRLRRRGVITTNPRDAICCGTERDEDGFCQHRPHHPIFVPLEYGTEDWKRNHERHCEGCIYRGVHGNPTWEEEKKSWR